MFPAGREGVTATLPDQILPEPARAVRGTGDLTVGNKDHDEP